MLGAPDLAHPAVAEQFDQVIATEVLSLPQPAAQTLERGSHGRGHGGAGVVRQVEHEHRQQRRNLCPGQRPHPDAEGVHRCRGHRDHEHLSRGRRHDHREDQNRHRIPRQFEDRVGQQLPRVDHADPERVDEHETESDFRLRPSAVRRVSHVHVHARGRRDREQLDCRDRHGRRERDRHGPEEDQVQEQPERPEPRRDCRKQPQVAAPLLRGTHRAAGSSSSTRSPWTVSGLAARGAITFREWVMAYANGA